MKTLTSLQDFKHLLKTLSIGHLIDMSKEALLCPRNDCTQALEQELELRFTNALAPTVNELEALAA